MNRKRVDGFVTQAGDFVCSGCVREKRYSKDELSEKVLSEKMQCSDCGGFCFPD